ncbi:MAG: class I SAM-dependent methyltransferase [Pirellulales bacterium]|nr:class I SAM-dependent methyltransferase [Pirellulales bacterium]
MPTLSLPAEVTKSPLRPVTGPGSFPATPASDNSPASKLLAKLRCPRCQGAFSSAVNGQAAHPGATASSGELPDLVCHPCGITAQQVHRSGAENVQIRCGGFTTSDVKTDWLNQVKESAKRVLGPRYQLAIDQISPVYTGFLNRRINRFLASFDLQREFVADLGSGPLRHDPRIICCDGMNYENVNLVTDLQQLPLAANSLDGVISVAVLEHVTHPQAHVAEMLRVLRPGGRVLCFIPFLQGYHASPYDYQRFTISGMRQLFADFQITSVEPAAGPTSALVWIMQEWLAMVLSLGIRPLYKLLMPLTYVLSPLKYLDVLLRHHPAAANIDSGFVIEASKPRVEEASPTLSAPGGKAPLAGPHF